MMYSNCIMICRHIRDRLYCLIKQEEFSVSVFEKPMMIILPGMQQLAAVPVFQSTYQLNNVQEYSPAGYLAAIASISNSLKTGLHVCAQAFKHSCTTGAVEMNFLCSAIVKSTT